MQTVTAGENECQEILVTAPYWHSLPQLTQQYFLFEVHRAENLMDLALTPILAPSEAAAPRSEYPQLCRAIHAKLYNM